MPLGFPVNLPFLRVDGDSTAFTAPCGCRCDLALHLVTRSRTGVYLKNPAGDDLGPGDVGYGGEDDPHPAPESDFSSLSFGAESVSDAEAGFLLACRETYGHDNGYDNPASFPGVQDVVHYHDGVLTYGNVTRRETEYKLRLNFLHPWQAEYGTVSFFWRIRTQQRAATETVTASGDPYSPTVVSTWDEDPSYSYEAKSVVVTPEIGAMYAETPWQDSPAPEPGQFCYLDGPGELSFLRVGTHFKFLALVNAGSANKAGFPAYFGDGTAPGVWRKYLTETATTATGSTGSYSGAQSVSVDENGATSLDDAFSDSVNRARVSGEDDSSQADAMLDQLRSRAVKLSPTSVQWDDGMILTLSDEDPTSRIVALALARLEQQEGYGFTGTDALDFVAAERRLPAHEQDCTLRRGSYTLKANIPIFRGLLSWQYANAEIPEVPDKPKWLLPASQTITFHWTKQTRPLDGGDPSDAAQTRDITIDGSDDALLGQQTSGEHAEALPAGNAEVRICRLYLPATTEDDEPATMERLMLPPQVSIG